MYKALIRFTNVITAVVLVAAVVIISLLLVPRAFGYDVYAVLSGSMEPYYHVGSIVYIKDVPTDQIQVGDPIAFQLDQNTVVTHRVVEINTEQRYFVTKGDANDINDFSPVSYSNVIGVGKYTIPYIGYISTNAQTKKGIFVCASILVVLILLQLLIEIFKPDEKNKVSNQKEKKSVEENNLSVHTQE